MNGAIQPYRGDYLRPAFHNATVADVMTPGLIMCAPEAPVETVAELMATHTVHAIANGGIKDRRVWGIVDSLDLMRAVGDPQANRFAEDIGGRPAVTIEPGAAVTEAAALMTKRGVAHLVVVDRERPVGVISTLDIAGAVAWGRR